MLRIAVYHIFTRGQYRCNSDDKKYAYKLLRPCYDLDTETRTRDPHQRSNTPDPGLGIFNLHHEHHNASNYSQNAKVIQP
jgi:hypothetical protein